MSVLIHPTYFPSVSHYVAMLKEDKVVIEVEDNFQKQTNRNRAYIYSANGVQMLNIPIKQDWKCEEHRFKDAKIEHAFGWQKQHFKSLESAYRTSPYFEFFEDDVRALFEKEYVYMLDLNLQIHEFVTDSLGIVIPLEKTLEYNKEVSDDVLDFRHLVNGKKDDNQFESYVQVFDDKHGFINNLSILDLLFNEGRRAVEYLKRQQVK